MIPPSDALHNLSLRFQSCIQVHSRGILQAGTRIDLCEVKGVSAGFSDHTCSRSPQPYTGISHRAEAGLYR
jgi:hypothetical protein